MKTVEPHDHPHLPGPWLFGEPVNAVVYSTDKVIEGQDILLVVHDTQKDWQLLHGSVDDRADEVCLVCLGCASEMDPSLLELACLPVGWMAIREDVLSPWVCSTLPVHAMG